MPGKDRPIGTIPELTQSEIIHFRKLKMQRQMITNLLDPKKVNHTPTTGKARMSSEIITNRTARTPPEFDPKEVQTLSPHSLKCHLLWNKLHLQSQGYSSPSEAARSLERTLVALSTSYRADGKDTGSPPCLLVLWISWAKVGWRRTFWQNKRGIDLYTPNGAAKAKNP